MIRRIEIFVVAVFTVFFSLVPGLVCAFPSISNVDGIVANGSEITISGSGFGLSGPNVHVFADFDVQGASTGSSIPMQATVGEFEGYHRNPVYGTVGRSGSLSGSLKGNRLQSHFEPTTEVFVSYAIYAPRGSTFPQTHWSGTHTGLNSMGYLEDSSLGIYVGPSGVGSQAVGARVYNLTDGSSCLIQAHTRTEVHCQLTGGRNNIWNTGDSFTIYRDPEEFPRESFMKIAWLGDPANGLLDRTNDKVLFSFSSGISGTTGGNDLNRTSTNGLQIHRSDNHWWKFGEWMRLSFWIRADLHNPSTASGEEWAQPMVEGVMQQQFYRSENPTFAGGTYPYQFSGINWWGWSRPQPAETSFDLMFDDIYLAIGPNSAARIELGNAPVYADATKLAISTPDSWSDTRVTATIREGSFGVGEQVYLFVIDKDNNPSVGFGPLVFGSEATTRDIVAPPTVLRLMQL